MTSTVEFSMIDSAVIPASPPSGWYPPLMASERAGPHPHPQLHATGWLLIALAIPLLWWVVNSPQQGLVDPKSFVAWHTALELFAIVVSMLVFVTGYRAVLSARNAAIVLLGVSFLGVGLLDFQHAMTYPGMPLASSSGSPQQTLFFWLLARLLAAVALLVYVSLPASPAVTVAGKRFAVLLVMGLVGVTALVESLAPDRVPALFVAGQGLTPLKFATEWLVVALNLMTIVALWFRRSQLRDECGMALGFAAGLSAVSQLFFTLPGEYFSNVAHLVGLGYKVTAYLYLFHATFNEALRRPLERMEAQYLRESMTLNSAPDGVLWVDESGTILMVNPAVEVLTGYPPSELLGGNVDIFLPPHLRGRHAQSMRSYFTAPRSRVMGLLDLKLLRRDGQMLPVDISLGHWRDHDSSYAIAYIRDLTERKQFEESLRHKATHDQLTGLPNRWLFRLQLDQALARANRVNQRVAVLFLDLDHFKNVNDSFGHATGDALLVQVGARMLAVLRESDTLARLGGDEFAILLSDVIELDEAVSVGAKLLSSLQASYRQQDQDIY
jgi:diguanylate cyclase (GGDEF)-like protein/PAS domain S-box-containing protein